MNLEPETKECPWCPFGFENISDHNSVSRGYWHPPGECTFEIAKRDFSIISHITKVKKVIDNAIMEAAKQSEKNLAYSRLDFNELFTQVGDKE